MKKMLSTFLTFIMLFNVSVTVFATLPEYGEEYQNQPLKEYSQTFKDVDANFWAFTCIAEMTERNVLSGYPNGNFYPNNTVTRAEFAKIMCLAAGLTVNVVNSTSYEDVKVSAWYAPFVECGKYYLSGYIADGKKYYKPEDKALREDIAVALVKLKGYDTSVYDESILKAMFTDWQSISEGARKYVAVAVENGLISGFEDNTFRGQASITRAQAATLLWRAYQYGNGNKVFEKEEFDEPVTPAPKPVDTTEQDDGPSYRDIEFSIETPTVTINEGEKANFIGTLFETTRSIKTNQIRKNIDLELDDAAEIEIMVKGDSDIFYNDGNCLDPNYIKYTKINNGVRLDFSTKKLVSGKYNAVFSINDGNGVTDIDITINVTEPEPEYTFELKTIASGVKGVDAIIATNEGAFYLYERSVYEVSKDGNSIKTLIKQNELEFLEYEEVSKAEKEQTRTKVQSIGYDPFLNKRYCILKQTTPSTSAILLYDLDTKEYINIEDFERSDAFEEIGSFKSFLINEFGNIIVGAYEADYRNNKVTCAEISGTRGNGQEFVNNNLYIIATNGLWDSVFEYDKRNGKTSKFDFYIPGPYELIGSDDKAFYFRAENNMIYKVDANGDSKILLGEDDVENVDGRVINFDAIEYKTSAVSPDGVIYYWDINYNSIRQLSEK